ncbi:ADP-ribosyltransferase family protein [Azohydromonas lata]|uniref:NAD(+)--protein-arginine ADP-ribosyltransferase n=1 Tax=Azohydromonas lata TaxID=45677 RepID=A0ABU5I7D0_9BURK|nr:hypothetical protein [Azohydromonas lata]MDZ5454993.1 hypothetical protein [Azohydromonas lata]
MSKATDTCQIHQVKIMAKIISAALPQTNSHSDPDWQNFTSYLRQYNILENKTPAIRCYQGLDEERNQYIKASHLNHCLSLLHYRDNSEYATIVDDAYDMNPEDDYYKKSLEELDNEFLKNSYKFSADSIVYKGIGSEPFYEILRLGSLDERNTVFFPGFLSTSVCREKAEAFCRGKNGILLEISGLNLIDCIIPENTPIPGSPKMHIPEQEVLLNRGALMQVLSVTPSTEYHLIIRLKVVNCTGAEFALKVGQ